MVKLFYGSNLDAIYWEINVKNIKKDILFFAPSTTLEEVYDKMSQFDLFSETNNKKIYVVEITKWKLISKAVKQMITSLHQLPDEIYFIDNSSSFKNAHFSSLKIETTKVNSITIRSKQQVIHYLLSEAQVSLDSQTENYFVNLLPDNFQFIKNEILKLSILNKKNLTREDIKQVVFNSGDATTFNVIDAWLAGDYDTTVARLNDLLAANFQILSIVPIFVYNLMQIKFYLEAKIMRWSDEQIMSKLGLPYWKQKQFVGFKPYDKKLIKINETLSKFYNFDINVKKQKKIPYSEFIRILFE